MKAVLISMVVLSLSGCSLIVPKVGPQVAKAVNRYCQEPQAARQLVRAEVNGMIEPHKIVVTCAGDLE